VVGPPRLNRRNAQFARSQLTTELLLWLLAIVSALLLVRLALKLLSISERIQTADLVLRITDLMVWPLTLLPGAGRDLVGNVRLPDITAVAIVLLLPLTFSLGGRVAGD
jgi:hypothetical protein